MESDVRIIKKYPNRRLYDTGKSCYIKLDAVRKLIEQAIPIKVVDSQTGEDITRSTLLQIIYEQEGKKEPLFSTENLQNFIRYYGENSRESFSYFMDKNLSFFQEQQEQMQKQIKELMDFNPIDFWTETTKKNMDMWQQLQDNFLSSSGMTKDKKSQDKDS